MHNISAATLLTRGFARAFILWAWILLTLALPFGSAVTPAAPHPYNQHDTLAVPTAVQDLRATPTQKFKAAEIFLDALHSVPHSEITLPVRNLALQYTVCSNSPRLLSAARQSPVLPHPPPSA